MTIRYEWCVESVDKGGDIQELDFIGSLKEAASVEPYPGCIAVVCLVRDNYAEDGELLTRHYWYPAEDDVGFRIPKRFINEYK
jgi:hypothetical protein